MNFPDEYPEGFRNYMLGRRPTFLVYVAGPFSAPDRAGVEANIQRASEAGVAVAKLGFCPVIPHANTAHPDFEHVQPYDFWIDATAEMLRRCDAILLIEGWEKSSGARMEKKVAESRGIPVFMSLEALAKAEDRRSMCDRTILPHSLKGCKL